MLTERYRIVVTLSETDQSGYIARGRKVGGKKEGAGRGDRETEREVLADHTRAPGTLQVQFQTTAIERTSQQSRSHRCFGFPVHARVM